MDSPFAAKFLRRLLAHDSGRICRAVTASTCLLRTRGTRRSVHQGSYSRRAKDEATQEIAWQPKTSIMPEDKTAEFREYPMITADQLKRKKRRPKRAKMLMRDFVEDSLYNPHYGYFSNHAVIFDAGEPFNFTAMQDEIEFQKQLSHRYKSFEDKLDEQEADQEIRDTRQLWHTPTELFKPHYAEAIGRYLIANYKISSYPYHDLNIYELGAGNGTFMVNLLDYIRDTDPEVYQRTRYQIIEISSSLAFRQANLLQRTASSQGHADKTEIINRSIFSWDTYVPSPCFFLALEVFDNFPHDVVRYNLTTEEPLQGIVLVDTRGDFFEFYTPQIDPVTARYFRVRDAACSFAYKHPFRSPRLLRSLRNSMPFAPNLSEPEFVPTRLMQFFDVLQRYFPAHKMVTSDFHALPNAVKGINAPVVQTRYQRRMVPVTTPLVHQGYFDILFPTDFNVMEDVYRAITGKLTRVLSHEDFMKRWAYVEETRTRSGENPLLSWYKNASVMITV